MTNQQVSKSASQQISKSASQQISKSASLQICKSADSVMWGTLVFPLQMMYSVLVYACDRSEPEKQRPSL
jgi:hypothetical protein